MPLSHFQLLTTCSEDQLQRICDRRRLPIPTRWEDGPEGRKRLLKTMAFHLEDNRHLTDILADLESPVLLALKHLSVAGSQPSAALAQELMDLGLALPKDGELVVPERVADALEDFDEGALSFQSAGEVALQQTQPFGFSLALSSVLLRCVGGIRVLKGGLPAKKELHQLLHRNALLKEDQDATLLFTLLHRLGLLWSREGRVDTLLPAVLSHPPRWVAERAFASLLEHDLKAWGMPPAEDRHFLMQHLLERRGQTLAVQPFLAFLRTLHTLDEARTAEVFLPFLKRMGLIAMDAAGSHLALTEHGEALAHEYLLRDHAGTEAHWQPMDHEAALVLQPNLEVLTPLLQNPHRLLRLAQVAEIEALDAMATFRVGHDTLVRALDMGVGLEDLRVRLSERASGPLPQPLVQLFDDLSARVGEVEVEQGARLVRARSASLAEELRLRPELAQLRLVPISDTVMEVRGQGNAFALLKAAGFLPKPARFLPVSLDGDEDLYLWALAALAFVDEKGMAHHLEPVRTMVRAALQKLHDEDANLYQEIQKRIPMLHMGTAQGPEETQRILEYAGSHTLMVELTYLPPAAHRTQLRRVTPREVDGDHLQAFCHLHQEEMAFRLSRIQGVRLLNERGWTPGAHSAAG